MNDNTKAYVEKCTIVFLFICISTIKKRTKRKISNNIKNDTAIHSTNNDDNNINNNNHRRTADYKL